MKQQILDAFNRSSNWDSALFEDILSATGIAPSYHDVKEIILQEDAAGRHSNMIIWYLKDIKARHGNLSSEYQRLEVKYSI